MKERPNDVSFPEECTLLFDRLAEVIRGYHVESIIAVCSRITAQVSIEFRLTRPSFIKAMGDVWDLEVERRRRFAMGDAQKN